jgi:hypothetical protein
VTIGDAAGLNGGPYYAAKWTTAAAVQAYLPAGGKPGKLTADLLNPITTPAGNLAAQVLALTLNREYSCAGVFEALDMIEDPFCYGDVVIPATVQPCNSA